MIDGCRLLNLNSIVDNRGGLTIIESGIDIDFDCKRVYYLHSLPTGSQRGGHAHYNLKQLIIAASGSFDVVLDNGLNKVTYTLDNPNVGLYLSNLVWRELINFSEGSVCLVLASDLYNESDYIRDYVEFKYQSSVRNGR